MCVMLCNCALYCIGLLVDFSKMVICRVQPGDAMLQAHRDVSPCYLLMSAVELAATRKALVRQLAQSRAGAPVPFDSSSVRKGRYLGQMESKRGGEGPIKHWWVPIA